MMNLSLRNGLQRMLTEAAVFAAGAAWERRSEASRWALQHAARLPLVARLSAKPRSPAGDVPAGALVPQTSHTPAASVLNLDAMLLELWRHGTRPAAMIAALNKAGAVAPGGAGWTERALLKILAGTGEP